MSTPFEPAPSEPLMAPLQPAFGQVHSHAAGLLTHHSDRTAWTPPAALATWHRPALVASLLQRVFTVVRDPVRNVEHAGRPALRLCGISVLQRDPAGRIQGWLWQPVDGAMALVAIPAAALTLHPCPAGFHWLRAIVAAFGLELRSQVRLTVVKPRSRARIRARARQEQADIDAYLGTLLGWLRRQLNRHADLRAMRERMARALALDARTLRLARSIHRAADFTDREVSAESWNLAVHHRLALQQVQDELPQILPLYGALLAGRELIVHEPDEAVLAVHQHLAQHGIRPATWRLLTRSSVRLLLAVRPMYRGPLAQAMVNHLLVLQGFGLHDEPAPELVNAIWSYQGNTGYRRTEYFDEVGGCAATFGHVARCHRAEKARTAAGDLPALREAMKDVVHWVHEAHITTLGKNQRRAGWRWLVRSARAWRETQRRREQGSTPWLVPEPLEIGEYRLVMLDRPFAVQDEGLTMHHCAAEHAPVCAAGHKVMVSIRRRDSDRRVATALYEPLQAAARACEEHGSWSLTQLRGPVNADTTSAICKAAQEARIWVGRHMTQQAARVALADDLPGASDLAETSASDLDADAPAPESLVWFEFEYGQTLRMADIRAPQRNADVFGDVDPSDLDTISDVVDLAQGTSPVLNLLANVVEQGLEALEAALEAGRQTKASRATLKALIADIEADPGEALHDWLLWTGKSGLKDCRSALASWLAEAPDFNQIEYFQNTSWSGQAAAMAWFENLPKAQRDVLGVSVVEGDCPGSSYFAAELHGAVEDANAAAARLGLACRFR